MPYIGFLLADHDWIMECEVHQHTERGRGGFLEERVLDVLVNHNCTYRHETSQDQLAVSETKLKEASPWRK